MTLYQQFRLDDQTLIWAESLLQAQQRWPLQHPVPVAAVPRAVVAPAAHAMPPAGPPAPLAARHVPIAPPARVMPPPHVIPPPPVNRVPLPLAQPAPWAGVWNISGPAGALELSGF
jgi:hypothetical protein